jgi:hypothetical protein
MKSKIRNALSALTLLASLFSPTTSFAGMHSVNVAVNVGVARPCGVPCVRPCGVRVVAVNRCFGGRCFRPRRQVIRTRTVIRSRGCGTMVFRSRTVRRCV